MKLSEASNIDDLRRLAKRRAHKMVFDYIDGGATDETTLRANTGAFDQWRLAYRVLAGVATIDTSTTVLGQKMALPFFASPAAGNRLFHHEGETAVAREAARAGIVYCLSTLASTSIEDIAAVSDGPRWFQLYVWKDRALVKEMLDRARAAGFTALILTVDLPVHGKRERDARNGFTIPPKIGPRQVFEALCRPAWTFDNLTKPAVRYANLSQETPAVSLAQFVGDQLHPGFTWDDAAWLLGEWGGPAILKGVVRPDDARRAVDLGFAAVMVSNHGGRQLDRSLAPVEALEPILQEVGSEAEIILDGGVRRASHMLIALALGAKAVSFARPWLYGLAAGGARGVRQAFEIMAEELRTDMALLGARSVAEIDRSMVTRAEAVPFGCQS